MTEQVRDEFEAWAFSLGWRDLERNESADYYFNERLDLLWIGWQSGWESARVKAAA